MGGRVAGGTNNPRHPATVSAANTHRDRREHSPRAKRVITPRNRPHEGDFGAVGEWHRAVGLLAVDEGPDLLQDGLRPLVVAGDDREEVGDGRAVGYLDLLGL